MEKKTKIRVICASCPLKAAEAKEFATRFMDNFEGKYLVSGKYKLNGKRERCPLYYVVWIPPKNLPLIHGHEMFVQRKECLAGIKAQNRSVLRG